MNIAAAAQEALTDWAMALPHLEPLPVIPASSLHAPLSLSPSGPFHLKRDFNMRSKRMVPFPSYGQQLWSCRRG